MTDTTFVVENTKGLTVSRVPAHPSGKDKALRRGEVTVAGAFVHRN
jgi:hypothetical protein